MDNSGNLDVNHRLEQIERNQESMGIILNELKVALLGNTYNKNKGYLDIVDALKERVDKLERNQSSLKWFLFGSGVTGGAGLVKVLESFF